MPNLLLVVDMNPNSEDSQGISKKVAERIKQAFINDDIVAFVVDMKNKGDGDVFTKEICDLLSDRYAQSLVDDLEDDDSYKEDNEYFNCCKKLWFEDELNECGSDCCDWIIFNKFDIYSRESDLDYYNNVTVVGNLEKVHLDVTAELFEELIQFYIESDNSCNIKEEINNSNIIIK